MAGPPLTENLPSYRKRDATGRARRGGAISLEAKRRSFYEAAQPEAVGRRARYRAVKVKSLNWNHVDGQPFASISSAESMEEAIRGAGRTPRQRTTLYGTPDTERTALSFGAAGLVEPDNPRVDTSGLRRPATLVRPGLAVS